MHSHVQVIALDVSQQNSITLGKLWRIVRARKYTVLNTLLVAMVLALAVTAIVPRRFEAVASILVNPENQNALGLNVMDAVRGGYLDNDLVQQTQIRIIQSDRIAWGVISRLRLDVRRDFAGQDASHDGGGIDTMPPSRRVALLERFRKRLRVSAVPKTQLIEVRFRDSDPATAAEVANAVANAYVENNFRTRFDATTQASEWLSKQLDELKSRVAASQDAFTEFQKKSGMIGTDETHNIYVIRLEELNKQLAAAQAERILKEARYRVAQEGRPELLAEVAPTSSLAVLRAQQADIRNQYVQLTSKYGKAHPHVIQASEQLAQLNAAIGVEVENVRARLQNEFRAAATAEQLLNGQVERQKDEAYRRNEAGVQFAILKRDVESSRDLYEDLQKKLKEAGILAGLRSTNINIIDPAEAPTVPAEPRLPLNIFVASVLGLLAGVSIAFVRENLDTTIRSSDCAEGIGDLPILGVVPREEFSSVNKLEGDPLLGDGTPLVLQRPESEFAESFRSLRTTLLLSSPGAPPKTVLVTSAAPGEGKTVTSVTTAIVLAQRGRRVLLVDADLRRSSLHRHLVPEHKGPGLSECLAGAAAPETTIVTVGSAPNLDVLLAGDRPPNPSELLDSDSMRALLAKWSGQYDHIIIDTPPVLGFADAIAPASMVDAVLLVARAQQTTKPSLMRARDILGRVHARVIGVVMNDVNLKSSDYRDYYGYSAKSEKYYSLHQHS